MGVVDYKAGILCPLLFFLEMQKGQRLVIIALLRTEIKPGGECSYTARSEPKELSYRAILCRPVHPQKGSALLCPGLIAVSLILS